MTGIGGDGFTHCWPGQRQWMIISAAPHDQNLPVLMADADLEPELSRLLPHGLMPYDQRLHLLPAWAQQLEMESNGKSVTATGEAVEWSTTPVIWGTAGTGCQHSFFQALHQGTDIVPLDILLPLRPTGLSLPGDWQSSHRVLAANALAQAEALAIGSPNGDEPHRHFAGDRPSSVISWQATGPFELGRLLALYEHVTAVSGFLWGSTALTSGASNLAR